MKQARFQEDPVVDEHQRQDRAPRRSSLSQKNHPGPLNFWPASGAAGSAPKSPHYPPPFESEYTTRRASRSSKAPPPTEDKRPEYDRDGIRVYAEDAAPPAPQALKSSRRDAHNITPRYAPPVSEKFQELKASAPVKIPNRNTGSGSGLLPSAMERPYYPEEHRHNYGGSPSGRQAPPDVDGLGFDNLYLSSGYGYGRSPRRDSTHAMTREQNTSQSSHSTDRDGRPTHSRHSSRDAEFLFPHQLGSTPSPRRKEFDVYRDGQDGSRHQRKRSPSTSGVPRRRGSIRERDDAVPSRAYEGAPPRTMRPSPNADPYSAHPHYSYDAPPPIQTNYAPQHSSHRRQSSATLPNMNSYSHSPVYSASPRGSGTSYDSGVPALKEIFIAVMGVTGSGKSTFIRTVTRDNRVKVGHGLRSCTADIDMYSCRIGNYKINLIDTPGFDDLKRSETDILQSISEYLAKSYYENAFLNGIIYLQRIQETRIQGSGLRCLSIFEKIVGMENMRNVLLVTNMWDTLPQPPSGRLPGESITAHEVGERKERELRETPEFWGRFLHAGAHYSRHLGTYKSAEQVVSHFLPSSSSDIGKPMTLLLQDELIHGRCRLEETTVGKYINDELYKQQKQYEKEVRDPKRKKELLDDVKAKGEILAMTVEDIVIPEEMGRRTCTVM